jgi:hypothetical protein
MKALAAFVMLTLSTSLQTPVFRSSAESVAVPVSVSDKNRPVGDLAAKDFDLFDNGVKQEITVTPIDTVPMDVTFLIDVSGSVKGRALDKIKLDVQEMASLLMPNDRVRLVSFARDASDVFGIKPGGATLDLSRMDSGGTSSFYDALILTLAASSGTDRPHLVFAVSDGRDNSSFSPAEAVVAVAKSSAAVLCITLVQSTNPLVREGGKIDAVDPLSDEASVINVPAGSSMSGSSGTGVVAGLPGGASARAGSVAISRNAGPYKGGPNVAVLRDASSITGGLLQTDASRTPVPQLFRRLLDDFRASYILSFTPTAMSPGTHTITVKAKNPAYAVRARKIYEQR